MKKIKLWLLILICPLLSLGQSRLTSTPGDFRVNNGIKIGNSLWATPGLIRYNSNTWWGYNGTSWVDIGSSATEEQVDNFVSNNGYFTDILLNDISLSNGYTGLNHGLDGAILSVQGYINNSWTPLKWVAITSDSLTIYSPSSLVCDIRIAYTLLNSNGNPLPEISSCTESVPGSDEVNISVLLDNSGASTTLSITYGTTLTYGITITYGVSISSPGTYSFTIGSLTPSTNYFYKVMATNLAGISIYTGQFKTTDGEVVIDYAPSIVFLNEDPPTASSFGVTVEVDPYDLSTTVKLLYAQTSTYAVDGEFTDSINYTSNPIISLTSCELNISGLTAETQYSYIAKAISSAGTTLSEVRTFTTTPVAAPPSEYVWRTTSSTGDTTFTIPGNSIVYIDPDNVASGRNGTIGAPYNSWTEIPDKNVANRTYLIKRGTTLNTGRINTLNVQNVSIGAYGTGLRPKIICTETGSNVHTINFGFYSNNALRAGNKSYIWGLDISSTTGLVTSGIRLDTGYEIWDCYIHDFIYAIRSTGDPIGTEGAIVNAYIGRTAVENIMEDGFFIQNVNNITFNRVLVQKVNKYWFTNPSDTYAPGDGIQLNMCGNILIENCKVDRSDTGNKFCVINTQGYSAPGQYITLTNNIFIVPRQTAYGGAGLYLSDTPTGVTIDFSNNVVENILGMPSVNGLWFHGTGSLESVSNSYRNLTEALGNHAANPQPVIYSDGDEFINCTVTIYGNITIL